MTGQGLLKDGEVAQPILSTGAMIMAIIVDKNSLRADHLRQSILKKAFSGKLIPSTGEYSRGIAHEMAMATEEVAPYGADSEK